MSRAATFTTSSTSSPHILIIGGAYAGFSAFLNLQNLFAGLPQKPSPFPLSDVAAPSPSTKPRVTLLDERDGIFHTVGTPLVHSAAGAARKSWKLYADIPALSAPGMRLMHGTVTAGGLDIARHIVTYKDAEEQKQRELAYDYLIVATGVQRGWPTVPRALDKAAYVTDAREYIAGLESVETDVPVVVIGGGAVGVEFAAEIKVCHPHTRVVLVHSRQELLSNEPLPDEFKDKVLEILRKEVGIEVMLGHRAAVIDEGRGVRLDDGTTIAAGVVVNCLQRHTPRTDFLPEEVRDESGYVKVGKNLSWAPDHYAIGDIAAWSGIKRCGGALAMGQVAATNIVKSIVAAENGELPKHEEFPEVPPMIALALGKTAVTYHPVAGVNSGEEPFKQSFGDDLGLSICWKALGLEI